MNRHSVFSLYVFHFIRLEVFYFVGLYNDRFDSKEEEKFEGWGKLFLVQIIFLFKDNRSQLA